VAIEDGERSVENAYIGACLSAGNVEALYYALLRKRARLQRNGHEEALEAFESKWGSWVKSIEGRI
jgi:hypothetical protein